MNDLTSLIVALSGFFHDVGKIVDPGALKLPKDYEEKNADLYQPSYKGHYSHAHALLTAAFIESKKNLFPPDVFQWSTDHGDSFINLCAMHHKPETPLQWIITAADRLSSGLDRHSAEEEGGSSIDPRKYRQTRLRPIFEELSLEEATGARPHVQRRYAYPLARLSASSIFPVPSQPDANNSENISRELYSKLFNDFINEFGSLLHRQESLALWFEHVDSCAMRYWSAMPAARAGDVVPDVSLYDHARTTAALASALYLYHRDTDSLAEEAIRSYEAEKFLLVSGDFYGIQDFIFRTFGQTKSLRAKLLRGRSLAVSMLCELAADLVCRKIGLPFSSVLLNAAGKFTIVAPHTAAAVQAISEAEKEINEWLVRVSYGENSLGISVQSCGPGDFTTQRFRDLWEASKEKMELKKTDRLDLNAYGGEVSTYLASFNNELGKPLCPLCGKRPSESAVEHSSLIGDVGSACRLCRDHVFLGTKLVTKERLAVLSADADVKDHENRLLEPLFGRYQLTFSSGSLNELARKGRLIRYWDLSPAEDGELRSNITMRLINGYAPVYSEDDLYDDRILETGRSDETKLDLIDAIHVGAPKTLEHIACKALNVPTNGSGRSKGLAALGILKADVDKLGALLAYGLPKESFTVSRLATLSRQLDFFFSLHLPHLLRTTPPYSDVYTVFAGGDDLFLIGPWNRIFSLVKRLRDDFADYVCHNQALHFSAGIAVKKPHTPLHDMAIEAEATLERSKDVGGNGITVFGQSVTHDVYEQLLGVKEKLLQWLEDGWVNNAMLYRLNSFADMAGLEQKLTKSGRPFPIGIMECTKWRAYLAYAAERNLAKNLAGDDRRAAVQELSQTIAGWLSTFGGGVKIPLWEVLYNRR
ncbi:MAG: type III-A CRISPR-associated protein Cas10/Csm1 [Desulfomonilaceae bacterium]